MPCQKLEQHRKVWREKPVLRAVYQRWYRQMLQHAPATGAILEIGAGSGNLKEYLPGIIASDYIFCSWLDLSLDAHELPFREGSLGAVIAADVLHHLDAPVAFLEEARRALKKGGRLILLEPFISPWSRPVYTYIHREDVDFSQDPFKTRKASKKDPFQGNMALATILFYKKAKKLEKHLPDFPVIKRQVSDFLLYPMSGGFEHPSFCPGFLAPAVMSLERMAAPFARILAYRTLIVMEKRSHP